MGFLVLLFIVGIFVTIFFCAVTYYKGAGIAACITLIFFLMMIATSQNANTSQSSSSSSSKSVECKICHREFREGSENAKSISWNNMCTQCYKNYKTAREIPVN